jgi:signal peptide peptidase SppA
MSYSAIVRAVYGSVWAILPEKLEAIDAFLKMKLAGGMASPEVIAAIRVDNEISAARAKSLAAGAPGAVAVLPLYGIINQRYAGDFSGPSGTSVQEFTQQFRQALNDPNVKAIVIDVDSPGGTVSGVEELATEIYNGRKQKKITAVSNCLCASAAYWLASQANEVCVSPTSMTGSIGVYQLHEDDSEALAAMGVKMSFISAGKYKVEGNPYQPLDDEARGAMQGTVDDFYGMFTKAVARGRGVAAKAVAAGYGQGRVLTAPDAVKQGLADRIATLDEVLSKYGVKQPGSNGTSSSTLENVGLFASAENDDTIVDPGDEDVSSMKCSCSCESCAAGDCAACTNEACTGMAQGCKGCPIAVDGDDDESKSAARSEAEARDRRLRLARA